MPYGHLHYVVSVFDDNGNEKTTKGLEDNDKPYQRIITIEKSCKNSKLIQNQIARKLEAMKMTF